MSKSICKKISKNLIDKYSQKPFDHAKQYLTDALKTTSKIAIQMTAEATGDLIGNKLSDKITKVSRGLWQNRSGTVKTET